MLGVNTNSRLNWPFWSPMVLDLSGSPTDFSSGLGNLTSFGSALEEKPQIVSNSLLTSVTVPVTNRSDMLSVYILCEKKMIHE